MKFVTIFLYLIFIYVPYVYSESPRENSKEDSCKIEYSIDAEGNVKLTNHMSQISNYYRDVSLKDDDGLISLMIIYNQMIQENTDPLILTKDQERILSQGLKRFESYFKKWDLALTGKKLNQEGQEIDLKESDGDYFEYFNKISKLKDVLKNCEEKPNGCPSHLQSEEMDLDFFRGKIKIALRNLNKLNEDKTLFEDLKIYPPKLTQKNISKLGEFLKSRMSQQDSTKGFELVTHGYELTKPNKSRFFLCEAYPEMIPRCIGFGCVDKDFSYFNSINQGLCGKLHGGYGHVYRDGQNPCPKMKFEYKNKRKLNFKMRNPKTEVRSN